MLKHVQLFGFNFISESNLSPIIDDIIAQDSYETGGCLPFLITPNVDEIVKFSKTEHAELKKLSVKSMYILPDGQPIVWSAKLFGKKLQNRLTGSDLFPLLLNNNRRGKILALTSSATISEALVKENPDIICYSLPFFGAKDANAIEEITNNCVKIISDNDIKIVIVGISSPKQHLLAVRTYAKLKAAQVNKIPLFCMLGASMEFYLNLKNRAPVFVQKIGMEWLYRFFSEPKRLFKRYFVEDIAFFSILFKEFKRSSNISS